MRERKNKPSINSQYKWLKDKKILIRKKRPSDRVIKRLYSFYHKYPLDTPLQVAYGMKKRISENIEVYGGNYELYTPGGKVTSEKYIKDRVKKREKLVRRSLSFKAHFVTNKYRPYIKRVQDYLVYRFNLIANEATLHDVLRKFERDNLPIIENDIKIYYKNYKNFYKTMLVGSIAKFVSTDFPQGKGESFLRVGFVRFYTNKYDEYRKFFVNELMDSVRRGFLIVKQYDRFDIKLVSIEIVFTSDVKASEYEKLRVRH